MSGLPTIGEANENPTSGPTPPPHVGRSGRSRSISPIGRGTPARSASPPVSLSSLRSRSTSPTGSPAPAPAPSAEPSPSSQTGSPGPAPEPTAISDCDRLRSLEIPLNGDAICWWLSVNLALFHKKRPELEAFFGKKGGDEKEQFQRVYNHYTGKNQVDMELLRTGIRDSLAKKTRAFNIASKRQESTQEYLMYVKSIITTLDYSFVQMINASPSDFQQVYDVYYHALYFGIPRNVDEGETINTTNPGLTAFYEFPDVVIPTTGNTVVFSFERKPKDNPYSNYSITPLKEIKLPTSKGERMTNMPVTSETKDKQHSEWMKLIMSSTDSTTFYLDAITVSTPGGGHYVTYIKCEDSDVWLYDNGLSAGALGSKEGHDEFASFDEMMSKKGDLIRENLVLLYYSKDVEATV